MIIRLTAKCAFTALAVSSLIFASAAFPRTAAACDCIPTSASSEGLKTSTLVFAGTVLEKTRVSIPQVHEDYKEFRIKFHVKRYWKGDPAKVIELRTPASPKGCGFDFRKGQSYLVYAVGEFVPLVTTCTRTILLSSSRSENDQLYLGEAKYP